MAELKPKHVYLISGWTNLFEDFMTFEGNKKDIEKIKSNPPCKVIAADSALVESSAYFNRFVLYHLGVIPFEEARLCVMTAPGRSMGGYGEHDPEFRKATKRDLKSKKCFYPTERDMDDKNGKRVWPEFKFDWNRPDETTNLDPDFDYKMDGVHVIPGEFEGVELKIIKETKCSWFAPLDVKILDFGLVSARVVPDTPQGQLYYLAGVPRHCRILNGEKALDELVRRGYEPFVPFFKKAVEKYEGVKI